MRDRGDSHGQQNTLISKIIVLLLLSYHCSIVAIDPLSQAMSIAQQGMAVQAEHLKVIAENLANELTAPEDSKQEPYRRKILIVGNEYEAKIGTELVKIKRYDTDRSAFKKVYNPEHPAADDQGIVMMPNVEKEQELADAAQTQINYEANAAVLEVTKTLIDRTIELLK